MLSLNRYGGALGTRRIYGTAQATSNAYFTIQGQAIVGAWLDQGGNHPTADITYDSSRNAPQTEVLRLVE